jgi:hypothetical protein
MNPHVIADIMKIMKVTTSQAKEIAEVVETEALLDWSEATSAQYRKAFKLAQAFIANGKSWEVNA